MIDPDHPYPRDVTSSVPNQQVYIARTDQESGKRIAEALATCRAIEAASNQEEE